MEHQVTGRGFMSTLNPQGAAVEANDEYACTAQPPSQDATVPPQTQFDWGANWNGESGSLVLPAHQITMPIDWLRQASATSPNDLHPPAAELAALPTLPAIVGDNGGQPLVPPTEWPQPSFGYGIGTDSFELDLSQLSLMTMPWSPTGPSPSIDGHTPVTTPLFQSDMISSYPLSPLEPEPPPSVPVQPLAVPLQHNNTLARQPEHQHQSRMTSGDGGLGSGEKGRAGFLHLDTEERTTKRRRGRPPTRILEDDFPPYLPSPATTQSIASTASPYSAIPSPNGRQLDNNSAIALSSSSDSGNTSQGASKRSSASSNTTTSSTSSNPSDLHTRNRLAASRYRAKTQAAVTELEAQERAVRARRHTLLACVGRLRDEVFELKNELLRHADCDCPLIREYLSHAAAQACAGLRASSSQG